MPKRAQPTFRFDFRKQVTLAACLPLLLSACAAGAPERPAVNAEIPPAPSYLTTTTVTPYKAGEYCEAVVDRFEAGVKSGNVKIKRVRNDWEAMRAQLAGRKATAEPAKTEEPQP